MAGHTDSVGGTPGLDCNQQGYPAEKSLEGASLLIRADATTRIGTGHVMRCLALAQAWMAQGGVVVFLSDLPRSLHERLLAEGVSVVQLQTEAGTRADAEQLISLAGQTQSRHIVVDGYHFGADYQSWVKAAGLKLLVLDDNVHAEYYYADLVLNQNIHANERLYPRREPYTQLLLGTQYTLLRREFWRWADWERKIPASARNLLITMGGSDPDNVTLKVLQALATLSDGSLSVKVVVGGGNPHRAILETVTNQQSCDVELIHDARDMPALMAWADVAISAGGSTCWELLFMGAPSIIIVLAENQRAIAEGLNTISVARSLGVFENITGRNITAGLQELLTDPEQLRRMAVAGRKLVDGRGVERVVFALGSS